MAMQWNNWICPVLFSITLQNLDVSSPEWWGAILLLCVATLGWLFGRLAVTHWALYFRPSSLYQLGLDKFGFRDACAYLVGSLTVLGTLQFLLVTWRLWPELSLLDLEKLQEDLIEAFPEGLEINLTNGVLTGNRPGPVWIEVPTLSLFDFCGGSLMWSLVSLDFGSPDLRDLGRVAVTAASYYVDFTPTFRVFEFDVGDKVEVAIDRDLMACGASRFVAPPPWLGGWMPATVYRVQPSTLLSDFRYSVQVWDPQGSQEPQPPTLAKAECNGTSLQNCTCSVTQTALRRKSYVLLDWEEETGKSISELQSSQAMLVLGSRSFANLEGFSFYHGQYWSHRNAVTGQMWQRYSKKEIRSSEQLQCVASIYCNSSDNGADLRCSRQEALARFKALERTLPYLSSLVHWKLILPLLIFLAWFACVLASILFRGLQLLIFWPFGYVAYALLRHVDTPMLTLGHSLVLAVFTGMPVVFASCTLELLWQMWSDGEQLHPELQRTLELVLNDYHLLFYIFLLWSSYVVIQLRSLQCFAHLRELLSQRGGRKAPTEDEDSQPSCRICFGGSESGRLISPCLCSGTMRFVHMDCLNMWRFASANPQSSFRCDQCHFEYSVQRALYANILRSALVLHTVTLVVFGGVVILCAYICYCIHWFHHGDGDDQLFSENFMEQVTNVSGIQEEDKEELLRIITRMNEWTICGIPFVHLMHGLTMVGMSGCNSLGFFLTQQVTSRGDSNPLPVISAVMIIAGLFRVFYSLYRFLKLLSGKVLESAEGMILDIRAADDAAPRMAHEATPAPRGEAMEGAEAPVADEPMADLAPAAPAPPAPEEGAEERTAFETFLDDVDDVDGLEGLEGLEGLDDGDHD